MKDSQNTVEINMKIDDGQGDPAFEANLRWRRVDIARVVKMERVMANTADELVKLGESEIEASIQVNGKPANAQR